MSVDGLEGFCRRHVGPDGRQIAAMLEELELATLDDLINTVLPTGIRMVDNLNLGAALTESQLQGRFREIAEKNRSFRSFIGMGYSACLTPSVIQRNILENPTWYTHYTPYQAEISQGRLEALLNFQTMVMDLTGLDLANASLLDEATAGAEAMAMMHVLQRGKRREAFFVSVDCHPQTIEVVRTRAEARGLRMEVGGQLQDWLAGEYFGALLQYPATDGRIDDLQSICEKVHESGALVAVATDLLALTLLRPPGEFGADIAFGTSQRFGMPMGFGGPHAAFFATRSQYKRHLPGRIIGVSSDADGQPALRMALQTREQHIRREKATSNICTAQVLPAVVASMYGVYHGAEGLHHIANRIHELACTLASGAVGMGYKLVNKQFFDTLALVTPNAEGLLQRAAESAINVRRIDKQTIGITLDEGTDSADIKDLLALLKSSAGDSVPTPTKYDATWQWDLVHTRVSPFMQHPVFSRYHSETEMLRYMKRLESRDLSLTTSMIPLGSCTMKLNGSTEMMALSWPKFADLHPFAPIEQAEGYAELFGELRAMLAEITGLPFVSLQPNAGSQGEFAGLLAIRAYQRDSGQGLRDLCLIPASAHGTNPASAVMAGMEVELVACDEQGNIDIGDLRRRAHSQCHRLAALMLTYPSTHGIFEVGIIEICRLIHQCGGQVYMDGANMNALVGLCRPGDFGVDVCHVNLHKTFCIPHGGGGPGMGPIAVADHLGEFLPSHPLATAVGRIPGPVAAAPWSSALILTISWAYIKMMGGEGLAHASQVAILNANYVARRLEPHFPILYQGQGGLVAHEAIIDLRHLREVAGVTVEDVAKRLMDYGYHAPTVSFPVGGTLMIEPTESEAKCELDRFCTAVIKIRDEIEEIIRGESDSEDNLLRNSPHTVEMFLLDEWPHSYSRERAVLPGEWQREHKFWPAVRRVDGARGDRQLVCTCPPVEAYG